MKLKSVLIVLSTLVVVLAVVVLVVLGESGAFMSEYGDDLDRFMKSRMNVVGVPGMAAGIVSKDGLAWEACYGTYDGTNPVSRDTLFMIASVSKTVVATAVMQLWEQGRFKLDDDINDYLDFRFRNPHHPEAVITIRQLMTHRSTIVDRWPFYMDMYTINSGGGDSKWALGDFLKAYLVPGGAFYSIENYQKEAPDERREYSNYGTALLAYLVERLSGEGFAAYCRARIFKPLGMEHSYYLLHDIPPYEKEIASAFVAGKPLPHYSFPDYPAGSLRTTIGDLARFASFYLAPAASGVEILKPETVATMFGEYGESSDLGEDQMGLLWVHMNWIFFNAVGHNGSDPGVGAFLLLYPEEGFAIILVMNGNPLMEKKPGKVFIQRGILERLYQEGRRLSTRRQPMADIGRRFEPKRKP